MSSFKYICRYLFILSIILFIFFSVDLGSLPSCPGLIEVPVTSSVLRVSARAISQSILPQLFFSPSQAHQPTNLKLPHAPVPPLSPQHIWIESFHVPK